MNKTRTRNFVIPSIPIWTAPWPKKPGDAIYDPGAVLPTNDVDRHASPGAGGEADRPAPAVLPPPRKPGPMPAFGLPSAMTEAVGNRAPSFTDPAPITDNTGLANAEGRIGQIERALKKCPPADVRADLELERDVLARQVTKFRAIRR